MAQPLVESIHGLIAKNRETATILIFSLIYGLLLTGFISNFRILTVLFFAVYIFLGLAFRSFLSAGFISTIAALPLFAPNKYYVVEILKPYDIVEQAFNSGYVLGYGLNLANIFIILSLIFLLKETLVDLTKPNGLFFWRRPGVVVVLISGSVFFTVGLGATLRYSPFLGASLTWLFQYMQYFSLAILVGYVGAKHPSAFRLLPKLILLSLFFEGTLTGMQFFNQSFLGLPIETGVGTYFPTGLDENNALFRPGGTFAFHNQLAVITLLSLSMIFPIALSGKPFFVIGLIVGLVTIVLTQSRSVWIGATAVSLLAFRSFTAEVTRLLKKKMKRKTLLIFAMLMASLSYVIIPRILLSFNAGYEGAGIPVRFRLFKEGIEAFIQNPWIGFGVGTNEYVLHSFFPNGVMSVFPTAIHFGTLQLALEVGVVGLIAFFFPIFFLIRALFAEKPSSFTKNNRAVRFTILAGFLSFAIYYIFLPHVGIIEFAYLGIILGLGMVSHPARS